MKRNATVILPLIVIITLALSGCHHGRYHHVTHNETRSIDYLTDKLDLNPAQQHEVDTIQDELTALKQEGQELRQAWYNHAIKQLKTEAVSDQANEDFTRQQAARIEEIGKRFSAALEKLRNVLTPEQRQTLAAELEKHDQRRHH